MKSNVCTYTRKLTTSVLSYFVRLLDVNVIENETEPQNKCTL